MGSTRIGARWLGSLIVAAAVMTACSDPSTAPSVASKLSSQPSFAIGDLIGTGSTATAVPTQVVICKTGNVGGTFTVTAPTAGSGGTGTPSIASPIVVANGTCRLVGIDNGDANLQKGDFFHIVETPAANTVQTLVSCTLNGTAVDQCAAAGNSYFTNTAHGWVITYNDVFTPPPPPGCTFTKGWYRNQGNPGVNVAYTDQGRTKAELQAIFAATPGQPGGVTWGDDNLTLNLYQQLLTALQNLKGANGPAAVHTAVLAAQAGTGGSGLAITTSLTHDQMADLVAVLTAFNEGTFANWPHCDD